MKHKPWRMALTDLAVTLISLALGLVLVFPIVYGMLGAFKTSAEFLAVPPRLLPVSFLNFSNFEAALDIAPFPRFALNSLAVSLMGTAVRLLFAVLAAYAFAFYDFKGKNALFFLLLATLMLPADTLLVTNYLTVSRMKLLDTYLGMAITSFVSASQMFMLRQSFRTVPRALREAAALDGCGDVRFLSTILLPVSTPILITLSAQSFVTLWNTYLWPLLVTNKADMRTIQVGITMLTSPDSSNHPLVLAGVTLSLLPSFIMFAVLQRSVKISMLSGSLVG